MYRFRHEALLPGRCLQLLPKLAVAIGLNEAIVLQQVQYWVSKFEETNDRKHYHDGYWWVWNSAAGWRTNFPFWSERTIERTIKVLREPVADSEKVVGREPLLIVGNYNSKGYDRTLWYRIDYLAYDRFFDKYDEKMGGNVTPIEMP